MSNSSPSSKRKLFGRGSRRGASRHHERRTSLERDVNGNVHYVLFPKTNNIEVEWVDGSPVIPLDDTINQMMENRPAYEPALEIIADKYDRDIDASHHSAMSSS